jgi:hypothetical protein
MQIMTAAAAAVSEVSGSRGGGSSRHGNVVCELSDKNNRAHSMQQVGSTPVSFCRQQITYRCHAQLQPDFLVKRLGSSES